MGYIKNHHNMLTFLNDCFALSGVSYIIEKKEQPIYSKPYIELDHVYIIYVECYKIFVVLLYYS